MNFEIIKKVSIISAILGGCLGVITLIPYINLFSFLFLTFLSAPAIIIYSKINNIMGIVDTREGALWGAGIGAVVFSAFFIVFVPISAIIGLIYRDGVYVVMKLFFSSGGGIMILIMSYIMVGMLIALFNAFTGTFTAYVYQQNANTTKEDNQTFKIDNQG